MGLKAKLYLYLDHVDQFVYEEVYPSLAEWNEICLELFPGPCLFDFSYLFQFDVVDVAQPTTLLQVKLLQGCFSRFLNFRNSTKLHKASHILPRIAQLPRQA